jgi:hypothetical protein
MKFRALENVRFPESDFLVQLLGTGQERNGGGRNLLLTGMRSGLEERGVCSAVRILPDSAPLVGTQVAR